MVETCSRLNYGNFWKFGVICCRRNCIDHPQHFAKFDVELKKVQCRETKENYRLTREQDMLWFQGLYFNQFDVLHVVL